MNQKIKVEFREYLWPGIKSTLIADAVIFLVRMGFIAAQHNDCLTIWAVHLWRHFKSAQIDHSAAIPARFGAEQPFLSVFLEFSTVNFCLRYGRHPVKGFFHPACGRSCDVEPDNVSGSVRLNGCNIKSIVPRK
ncbi:MAG: hypothetical protein HZA50_05100 [Planctomycetes bacterium]|nr:hypothetical protein [Planctomycetota bacterium]